MKDEIGAVAKKTGRILLPALLLLALPAERALAADCQLKLLNTVPMRVTNNLLTVSADVNGASHSFQFDTAAIANQVTGVSARTMGLALSSYNGAADVTGSPAAVQNGVGGLRSANVGSPATLEIYDAKGTMFKDVAFAHDFMLGAMQNSEVPFQITNLPPQGVDGVINIDMFRRFDVDLNFAAGSLNNFAPDHCKGQILYWRAPGVTALPFLSRDNRIVARVLLEGKELTAVIDTGSPVSEIRFADAQRLFGITQDSPGVTLMGEHHPDDIRQDRYAYGFKTLSFGSVAIGNPRIMLTRDILVRGANPNPRTGSRVMSDAGDVQPAMLIGIDTLKLLHLYFALNERVLYVTQGPEMAAGAAGAQPMVTVTPFRP